VTDGGSLSISLFFFLCSRFQRQQINSKIETKIHVSAEAIDEATATIPT
jgi:hypothetical protein